MMLGMTCARLIPSAPAPSGGASVTLAGPLPVGVTTFLRGSAGPLAGYLVPSGIRRGADAAPALVGRDTDA